MWSSLKEILALFQRLLDQLVLGIVEVPDGLFEITDATVDKLCALAAGAGAEVVALNHGDLEAAGGGIEGYAGTCSATANHQNIVLLRLDIALFQVGYLFQAGFFFWEARQLEFAIRTKSSRDGGPFVAGDLSRPVRVDKESTTNSSNTSWQGEAP